MAKDTKRHMLAIGAYRKTLKALDRHRILDFISKMDRRRSLALPGAYLDGKVVKTIDDWRRRWEKASGKKFPFPKQKHRRRAPGGVVGIK